MAKYLTRRQKRILRLIDEDLTSQQIADQTGTSVRTVETQRYQINKNFGVHSTYEALQLAKKKGLL
jgi:DNA-binding CsgD family transcriptional regulator